MNKILEEELFVAYISTIYNIQYIYIYSNEIIKYCC